MKFVFEERPSDSPFIEAIWRTRSDGGTFISAAASNMELVVTRQKGRLSLTVRGPETKASPAPIPEDAEMFGMIFKLGTFMPHLPFTSLVNGSINLPEGAGKTFWMQGASWEFPTFDNADTFLARLVRQGLMAHDPVVSATLHGKLTDLSARALQRRFLRATGLTQQTMAQIERARHAMTLLQQGVPILDTMLQAGYYDQSHMTRSLKLLIGQTPAQILNDRNNE